MKTKTKVTTKTIAPKVKLDTSAKIVLSSIQSKAAPLIKKLSKLSITTQDEYDSAALTMSVLKQYGKQATEKKKSLLDPLKEVEAGIKELFKPFEKEVADYEAMVKDGMVAFINKRELAQAKILEDVESGKIKNISTAVKRSDALMVVSSANSKIRNVWEAEVIDESAIPRKYMVPNMAAVRADLQAGKKVAGVTWKQVKNIAI